MSIILGFCLKPNDFSVKARVLFTKMTKTIIQNIRTIPQFGIFLKMVNETPGLSIHKGNIVVTFTELSHSPNINQQL